MVNKDKLTLRDILKTGDYEELAEAEIFQYCSVPVFQKMIEKKELWLTHYSAMNDARECQILTERLAAWRLGAGKKVDDSTWKEFISLYNKKSYKDIYMSCFSLESDLLSQWRAYADDGRGFSVGFKLKNLKIEPYKLPLKNQEIIDAMSILPVVYDRKIQDKALNRLLSPYKVKAAAEDPKLKFGLFLQLRCLSLIFKNHGFQEEKEVRITLTPSRASKQRDLGDEKYPSYRVASSSLSPYYVLSFDTTALTRIVLGPRNQSDERHIKDFLRRQNISFSRRIVIQGETVSAKDRIKRASASYRGRG